MSLNVREGIEMASSQIDLVVGPILVARPGLTISPHGPNPGIGGTEFQTAQLALELARTRAFRSVTVAQVRNALSFEGAEVFSDQISEAKNFSGIPGTVLVIPATSLLEIPVENLTGVRIVPQSHHPHDQRFIRAIKRHHPVAAVSVGRYAFHSNSQNWLTNHFHIPNLFCPPGTASPNGEYCLGQRLTVGHISSLQPVKGFLEVAKVWPAIKKDFPEATLEVVGGDGLWGITNDNHPWLPMELDYGNQVLAALGDSIDSVRFLGRIDNGVDDVIRSWTLGIVNPRGLDESDPGSLKDFIRAGVPALGGYDFGLTDYLSSFRDLQIRDPHRIPGMVSRIASNSNLHGRLSTEFRELSVELTRRNELIMEVWQELITSVWADKDFKKVKDMTRSFFRPRTPLEHRVRILKRKRKGV